MNSKAQGTGPLTAIILIMVFVVIWFIFLANFTNDIGDQAIQSQGLTGVVAFVLSNINLFIFIGLFIGTMIFFAIGGSSGG